MIFPIWEAFRKSPGRPEAAPAAGMRIYAIGDIHGRLDLLDVILRRVDDDLGENPPECEAAIVFLGDYVDRGLQSAGVVERLTSGAFPARVVALRGNHEATLLDFLENPDVLEDWRRYGGLETLASYKVDVKEAMRGREYERVRDAFAQALPTRHREFLEKTLLSWESGDYFFCHAGARPNVPLAQQSERDLLWIREEFNTFRGFFEKLIVHGHTPATKVEVLPNRINIDTGAYATGVLTCLVLEGTDRRFISTGAVVAPE